MIDMYVIYIRKEFSHLIKGELYPYKRYVYDNDAINEDIIYAFTKKKKYAKRFINERSKRIFYCLESDDYCLEDDLYANYSLLELKNNKYDCGTEAVRAPSHVHILSTYHEYSLCDKDSSDVDIVSDLVSECADVMLYADYYPFKRKYVEALSILGYCNFYDLMFADNEQRGEYASYDTSYNLQGDVFGYKSSPNSVQQIMSEFSQFLRLFTKLYD